MATEPVPGVPQGRAMELWRGVLCSNKPNSDRPHKRVQRGVTLAPFLGYLLCARQESKHLIHRNVFILAAALGSRILLFPSYRSENHSPEFLHDSPEIAQLERGRHKPSYEWKGQTLLLCLLGMEPKNLAHAKQVLNP